MVSVLTLSVALLVSGAPADLSATTPSMEAADCTVAGMPAPVLGDFGALAVCEADCGTYPDVSCSGTDCQAVNRNCSNNQRGYVVCDGDYTRCPVCPVCEEDDIRTHRTGRCCDYPDEGELTYFQTCENGQWVTNSTLCLPNLQCIQPF